MRPWVWFLWMFQTTCSFILMGWIPLDKCGPSSRTLLVPLMSSSHIKLRQSFHHLYYILFPLLRTFWWDLNNKYYYYRVLRKWRLLRSVFIWYCQRFEETFKFSLLSSCRLWMLWVLDLSCPLLMYSMIIWLESKPSFHSWTLSQNQSTRHCFPKLLQGSQRRNWSSNQIQWAVRVPPSLPRLDAQKSSLTCKPSKSSDSSSKIKNFTGDPCSLYGNEGHLASKCRRCLEALKEFVQQHTIASLKPPSPPSRKWHVLFTQVLSSSTTWILDSSASHHDTLTWFG